MMAKLRCPTDACSTYSTAYIQLMQTATVECPPLGLRARADRPAAPQQLTDALPDKVSSLEKDLQPNCQPVEDV